MKKKQDINANYRTPLRVIMIRKVSQFYYPVCPRCDVSLEREYQAYCDRCGQALSWKGFRNAELENEDTKQCS